MNPLNRRVELKCATSQDPIDRHAKERIKELLVRKCAHVVQEHLPELLRLDIIGCRWSLYWSVVMVYVCVRYVLRVTYKSVKILIISHVTFTKVNKSVTKLNH